MFRRLIQAFNKKTNSAARAVRIGEGSPISFLLPRGFHHETDGENQSFIMPGELDLSGPVSLRISYLQDQSAYLVTSELQQELLLRMQPDSQIFRFGSNLVSPIAQEKTEEDGTEWIYLHHLISVRGFISTATVQIIKARAAEAGIAELRDSLPSIFESMKSM